MAAYNLLLEKWYGSEVDWQTPVNVNITVIVVLQVLECYFEDHLPFGICF